MKKCIICGKTLQDAEIICPQCGFKVETIYFLSDKHYTNWLKKIMEPYLRKQKLTSNNQLEEMHQMEEKQLQEKQRTQSQRDAEEAQQNHTVNRNGQLRETSGKTKKRWIPIACLLIAVAVIGGVAGIVSNRYQTASPSDNIDWTLSEDGESLTFTGSGNIESDETSQWTESKDEVKTIIIGEGISGIGEHAFVNFSSLENIILSKSVKSISNAGFQNCSNLKTVTIPGSVTNMDANAFVDCNHLESVYFCGNAPEISGSDTNNPSGIFSSTELAAYYPEDAAGWEDVIHKDDGGKTTWIAYDLNQHPHIYMPTYSWVSDRSSCIATFACVCGESPTKKVACEVSSKAVDSDTIIFTAACTYSKRHYEDIKTEKTSAMFSDVIQAAYYCDAVEWAVKEGITFGTDETHFSPNRTCTRAQVISFLWNFNGQPEPKPDESPFEDVTPSDWYYDAVMWAVQNDIALDTTGTSFAPDTQCTRAEAVVYLWNMNGRPTATMSNSFDDIKSSDWYYDAVMWALENEITYGITDTNFNPDQICTRSQVVSLLWNMEEN